MFEVKFTTMPEQMTVFEAKKRMKLLTAQKKPFSFKHLTYSSSTRKSNGIRTVESALLRMAAKKEDMKHADDQLFYMDLKTKEPRMAWDCLLIEFNGIPLQLR